ncbi:MAG: branched-chain amino acid ABC transporter permease [Alphaproteobacteria bacterium]|nr:branched-chain amino acid ABC transporter permease [Alphaproteobacteria bacterium]
MVPSTLIAQKNWYRMGNLTDIALLSLISLGVWITFYMGRINIGQGAFALIGGYVAAYLMQKQGLSFWLSVPLAGLFASFVSVLIGLPILRLRGVYFAMVSLTLTQVATLLALSSPMKPFTGSAGGLTNLPLPGALTIFGLTIIPDFASLPDGKVGFYYLAVILLMVSFLLLHRLVHSRQGILSRSLQQNEELASSIGVDIARLRLISYAICSFVGGVGGAIFISSIQSISSSAFVVKDSVDFMLYCFVGGLSNIFGPIVGATTLYFAWDWLSILGDYQLLVYATLIILLMLFVPNGLLSIRWKNMLDVNNRRQSVATIRKPAATKIKGTVRKGKK